jgi:hypothetical protein
MRRRIWRRLTGGCEEDREAEREARDCGAMERTGRLCDGEEEGGFVERKLRTSVWDWIVMSTDSAEVMHPLSIMI